MAEIITILSRKGGTGKTTTAQSISGALQKKKKSVLLIDLDAQGNLTASMNAPATGYNVTQLLEKNIKPAQAIRKTDNGDIITASRFLTAADLVMESDKELNRAIEPIKPLYDYIIIDTPANYGRLTRNALAASTSAIITAEASKYSKDGLTEIIDIINQIKDINPALVLRGVIVTKYAGRSNEVKKILEEMRTEADKLGAPIIDPPIRLTDKVIEAQNARRNLAEYAPRSTAAKCYDEITEKILKW